jgi:C4-dicarboxylate-specific signal transduction histidine kinase
MFENAVALYVEDEDMIRESIGELLQAMFKNFYTAKNGLDGYDVYREKQDEIDIVITDINMPKLNGLDMLEKIKALNPFIPMLITTAYNESNFLQRAIDIGVTGYINKPIDIRKLLEVIKKNAMPIVEKKQLELKLKEQEDERIQQAKFSAIGQLAAGITHEINTPITYIKGTLEMLQYDMEDLPDSETKVQMLRDTKTIVDGIRRMENIISAMKEMACQSSVNKEKTNIYATILVALTMTYNKCKHISNVYLNGEQYTTLLDKNQEIFMTNVQKQRIEQVWIVIINNAMDELIKKDNFEDRKLEICIENTDDNRVKILFKDNAGGINEDILDNIFEPFKSTKTSSGMGIGLNIAQKIVDDNDGTIVSYNENDGAVFEVIL